MATWRWRRNWPWLVAVCLLVALFLGVWLWLWFVPSVSVLVLQPRELVHSVVATATVQSPHRASLGVQIAGQVRAVPVLEGERIQQGQTLLCLHDSELRSALAAAELGVQQSGFKLRQWREVQAPTARAGDLQAQANLLEASAQLARQQALFRQGFIAQAALDTALRAYKVAESLASSAQAQKTAHEDQGLEQQLAQNAWVLARANADAVRARLSYACLQAPFDGVVVSRTVEPGDLVQPGKTLLLLAPLGVTELVAQIDERNLSLLKIGQPALASADAFPAQKFAAQVGAIAPSVDAQRGSVQVKLLVPAPPENLRQDMTVSVSIEVGREAAALAVPLDAVHESDTAHPWVWRVSPSSKLQRVPVQMGLRSGAWVQLSAGVSASDRLVSGPGSGWRDGQRVRIQPH